MSSSPADSPLSPHAQGVLLSVRLQPGARAARIEGVRTLDDGCAVLVVRVSEPAVEGKANAALIRLLAKSSRLPKSSISLVAGRQDRRKLILIEGETRALMRDLAGLLNSEGSGGPPRRALS